MPQIHLHLIPWSLRNSKERVWQVFVVIQNSHSLSGLIEVKNALNKLRVQGIVLVENNSPALKKLGWDKLDEGLYYRYFE